MKKNQHGFSVVEGLFVLVIMGLIGFVGYYVWNADNKTEQAIPSAPNKTAIIKTTTYTNKEGGYSFQLPTNWTAEYLEGTGPSFLTLKPKGFKAPGQENNWVMQINITSLPGEYAAGEKFANFEEFKKVTLEQAVDKKPVNKEIEINGSPVWKFYQVAPNLGGPTRKDITGGSKDLSYYYHKNSDRLISLHMRVYQHFSTNYLGEKVNSSYDYAKYLPEFEAIAKSIKLD